MRFTDSDQGNKAIIFELNKAIFKASSIFEVVGAGTKIGLSHYRPIFFLPVLK
jgi:hypothetical protein